MAAGGGGVEVWEELGRPSPVAPTVPAVLKGRWRGRRLEGESPRESGRRSCWGGVAVVLGGQSHRPVLGCYLPLGVRWEVTVDQKCDMRSDLCFQKDPLKLSG